MATGECLVSNAVYEYSFRDIQFRPPEYQIKLVAILDPQVINADCANRNYIVLVNVKSGGLQIKHDQAHAIQAPAVQFLRDRQVIKRCVAAALTKPMFNAVEHDVPFPVQS